MMIAIVQSGQRSMAVVKIVVPGYSVWLWWPGNQASLAGRVGPAASWPLGVERGRSGPVVLNLLEGRTSKLSFFHYVPSST